MQNSGKSLVSTHTHTGTAHTFSSALKGVASCHIEPSTYSSEPPRHGKSPYGIRPLVVAEREEREARGITPADYGRKWKSAYRSLIGEVPLCGPGELGKARAFLERVRQAIEAGGWTPAENRRLWKMKRVWEARVSGHDPRFLVVGNVGGKLSGEDRRLVQVLATIMGVCNG